MMDSVPQNAVTDECSLTEAVEARLGDPRNPDNLLSFAYSQRIDESEQFPEEAVRWMYDHQISHYFVPTELGGKFRSFEELGELIRLLSRRDLSSAHALSMLLWAFLTWMDGSDEQKRWLAECILSRHGTTCLAYSEKDHGSDLLGGSTIAEKTSNGFRVTGEKWPISRATRSDICYLLATTDHSAGPRALSMFMVDKSLLDTDRYSHLPKVRTLGLRGGDISGIRFDQCLIPANSLLGREGMGLEAALKHFQTSRTLCADFSLGCGDTALRTTLEFALHRTLYAVRVIDMPHAVKVLSDAFLDLLICDCVTTSGLRAFHVVPEQSSVWSAVVKYFVPTTIEAMIQNLSVVLGARFYMREEHEWGTFQRVQRDAAIISMFDGSTVVNLHALLLQFRQLARRRGEHADHATRIRQLFGSECPVQPFEGSKLSLVSREANEALENVELTLNRLRSPDFEKAVARQELDRILAMGEQLLHKIKRHHDEFSNTKFEHGHRQSAAAFKTARSYCGLHAAATCLHSWTWNTGNGNPFFSSGKWLVPALSRLFETYFNIPEPPGDEVASQELLEELQRLYSDNRMFSIKASRLGG